MGELILAFYRDTKGWAIHRILLRMLAHDIHPEKACA
jgi:hypothetical protein